MTYPLITCRECNKVDEAHYDVETQQGMINNQLCFKCLHWYECYLERNEPNVVRVGGKHFHIVPEPPKTISAACKGFGGQQFKVIFNDGRIVTTTNLWCQGIIPDRWLSRLPDNARFAYD